MRALLWAETRRFISRRVLRLALLLVLAGYLLAGILAFVNSSADPQAGLDEARRQVRQCERFRAEAGGTEEAFHCPTVEEIAPFFDQRFRYAESAREAVRGVGVAFMALGLVLGASFVGAEWGSGTITTVLTWEPRRGRLLAARLISSAAVWAGASIVLLGVLLLVLLPAGAFRGTTQGAGWTWLRSVSWIGARGGVLAAMGSAFGVGLAMLFRNTAAAIGLGLAYGGIVDPLLGLWRRGRLLPWLLQRNLLVFVGAPPPQPAPDPTLGFVQPQATPSVARAGVLLGLYAAAVLLVAYASFRSRDVT